VYGVNGGGYGVAGQSTTGTGVFGIHTASSGSRPGVRGETHSTGPSNGVEGEAVSSSGSGVVGVNTASSGGYGVTGASSAKDGRGVYGIGTGFNGRGVYGTGDTGVFGTGDAGVAGNSPSGYGLVASSSSGTGIYAYSTYGSAGYFEGPVIVTGGCTGPSLLQIDHPLDPAHKYLQHSFVESPDMMDIYNGNVTTDGKGFATITMPRYFQALNRSFRYQLTSLSGLQEVAVAKEIAHNRFTIQSEKPHAKVSWQVTGIRHDRFANAHRIKVVLPKARAEQGKYLHPELYGKPKSQAIGYRKPPTLPQRPSREH